MLATVNALHEQLISLERQVRWHRRIGMIAVVLIGALASAAFQATGERSRFTEIDVERLNVVEPDGQLVLASANTARLPDPVIAGETVPTPRTGPGMIFFDGEGWEVGGLIYGTDGADGSAYGHFSLDQFHNDQVVYLSYQDDGRLKSAGLYIVDRKRSPTIDEAIRLRNEIENTTGDARDVLEARLRGNSAQRIFVGTQNETALVRMRDLAGRDRIRLSVDPQGEATLEFVNEEGQVVQRLPN